MIGSQLLSKHVITKFHTNPDLSQSTKLVCFILGWIFRNVTATKMKTKCHFNLNDTWRKNSRKLRGKNGILFIKNF